MLAYWAVGEPPEHTLQAGLPWDPGVSEPLCGGAWDDRMGDWDIQPLLSRLSKVWPFPTAALMDVQTA